MLELLTRLDAERRHSWLSQSPTQESRHRLRCAMLDFSILSRPSFSDGRLHSAKEISDVSSEQAKFPNCPARPTPKNTADAGALRIRGKLTSDPGLRSSDSTTKKAPSMCWRSHLALLGMVCWHEPNVAQGPGTLPMPSVPALEPEKVKLS